MKVNNTLRSIARYTTLSIYRITAALGGLCILILAVSFSATLLDFSLSLVNTPPFFISWTGKAILTLTWLIAAIKWWQHHKKTIIRINQFTPEQRKEYEDEKLKRKKASEARSDKITLLLVGGFILYLIGKSSLGHALIGMLFNLIDSILNYKTFIYLIAFYVFYAVIQALNQISNNIYHGITEIKEKLDIIISQTEPD